MRSITVTKLAPRLQTDFKGCLVKTTNIDMHGLPPADNLHRIKCKCDYWTNETKMSVNDDDGSKHMLHVVCHIVMN